MFIAVSLLKDLSTKNLIILVSKFKNFQILFSFLTFASTHFVVNQDGGWTPWQRDGYIDCCVWGDFAKFKRYCQNPYPEGSGKICNSTANPQGAMEEEEWGTCTCGCSKPSCDNVGHTTFCVNDTWRPAYCECKPGLVRPDQWDPFEDPQICVIRKWELSYCSLLIAVYSSSAKIRHII